MQHSALDLFDLDPQELRCQSVEEARALDRLAVEQLGMPSILLMENAARGLAQEARRRIGDGDVLVLAGPGNNGGDGLALARLLAPRARIALLAAPEPARSPDAALQLSILRLAGIEVSMAPGPEELERLVAGCGLIVDALLGTGQSSAPREPFAGWIRWINDRPEPTLAVDLPSGFNAETGEAYDPCVQAVSTVSFARPKRGFYRDGVLAPELGRLRVVSIGLPETWVEETEGMQDRLE